MTHFRQWEEVQDLLGIRRRRRKEGGAPPPHLVVRMTGRGVPRIKPKTRKRGIIILIKLLKGVAGYVR